MPLRVVGFESMQPCPIPPSLSMCFLFPVEDVNSQLPAPATMPDIFGDVMMDSPF